MSHQNKSLSASIQDIHATDQQGRTQLHLAVDELDFERVKHLLALGADPNRTNPLGQSTIIRAVLAIFNHRQWSYEKKTADDIGIQILSTLAHHGADIHIQDIHKKTALHFAAEFSLNKAVDTLLELGANVHAFDPQNTPLLEAIMTTEPVSKAIPIVHCLLQAGADPNVCNLFGNTPLHFWVRKAGCEEEGLNITRKLLKYGGDINAVNLNQQTPLFWACGARDLVTLKLLLEHGANPTLKDKQEQTCLHCLARNNHPDTVAMAQALIQYGADPQTTDHHGETPLLIAGTQKNTALFEYLLPQQNNLHVLNHQGISVADVVRNSPMEKLLHEEMVRREREILALEAPTASPHHPKPRL